MSNSDPAILAIGTALPSLVASQGDLYDWMAQSLAAHPKIVRWLRSLYAYSGIDQRHLCLRDFLLDPQQSRYAPGGPLPQVATTSERMALYESASTPLAAEAARAALADLAAASGESPEQIAASITHMITISCTGFFAPGLDLALTRELGLPETIGRINIGFMGCSAMFNGLRTARQIVRGDPRARVLVVSVELCSLHLQPGTRRENLISASLFSDGSSASIVGQGGDWGDWFSLEQVHSQVKPNTRGEMVWQIGNHGFELVLSPHIPDHLSDVVPAVLGDLFADTRPAFWAVHPGGPAILDGLAAMLDLGEQELWASREVLRLCGNMSSATVLFVLDEIRRQLRKQAEPAVGVAMAFGPGLVVETTRLVYQPAGKQRDGGRAQREAQGETQAIIANGTQR